MKIPLKVLLIVFFSLAFGIKSVKSVTLSFENQSNRNSLEAKSHNIHEVCELSFDLCLELLPKYLNESVQFSRLWYAYKLYQLEALSALERFDESEKALLPLISKKNLPEKFKIYSMILYAKILQYKGNSESALNYFNKAKTLLLAVNNDWPKPLELIKVANMMFYMEQYQIGYEMLLALDKKFSHYSDAIFKYRLYTNLGHFSLYLNDHQSHILYRRKALHWANLSNNKNRQAIATFNIARAHLFIEHFDVALAHFQQTIPFTKAAKNQSLLNHTYLNMADIYQRTRDLASVKELLLQVDSTTLNGSYAELFQRLSKNVE